MKFFFTLILVGLLSTTAYCETLQKDNKEYGYYLASNPEQLVVFRKDRTQLNLSHVAESAEPCDRGNVHVCIKSKRTLFTVPAPDKMNEKELIPGTSLFVDKISAVKENGKRAQLIQITDSEPDGTRITYFYSTLSGLRYFTVHKDTNTLFYLSLDSQGYGIPNSNSNIHQ